MGGRLCAPTDVNGFAEALRELLTDPALREAMGEHNLASIQPYGLPSVMERMAQLYSEQLAPGEAH